MNDRPRWSDVRARLAEHGFRPSRRFGQNFLLDENLIRAMVRDAGVEAGTRVLEVGVGCGFLTLPLVEAGAELVAAEIDPRVLEVARSLLAEREGSDANDSEGDTASDGANDSANDGANDADAARAGSVRWFLGDALAGKHRLNPDLAALLWTDGPWKLVANLPYSISAPLMAVLSELPNPPVEMHALVQLEVAERIAAAPGTSDWGPISIRLQASYAARVGREVPANLFWPRPKVSSAVCHLERRAEPPAPEDRAELAALAAGLFHRRRQGVGRVLGDLLGDREVARAALAAVGVDPAARAETLPLEAFLALSRAAAWRDRPVRR